MLKIKFATCFALDASALPTAEKPDTWPPHPQEKAATERWIVKNVGVSFVRSFFTLLKYYFGMSDSDQTVKYLYHVPVEDNYAGRNSRTSGDASVIDNSDW